MTKTIQLKISLEGIKPKIWRRFAVKDSISFNYFHKIIQKVMGWENYHMFQFVIGNETITSPEEGHNLAEASFKTIFQSPEFLKMIEEREKSGKLEGSLDADKTNEMMEKAKKDTPKEKYDLKTKVSQLLNSEGQEFIYMYDFGDNWKHTIIVEKINEEDKTKKYPLCLEGERACPPEDCGSVDGYYDLMKIRKNKSHPQYTELIVEWLGEEYDPERFDAKWADITLREKENAGGWVIFVPLGKLLKEDRPQVKGIKTIFNRECEYEDYLGGIEYTVAEFFLKDRTLKDKDVKQAIENIKKNYFEDLNFFQTKLEKEIVLRLSAVLQEKSITHHELKLVFDYALWSIDNRSWMSDSQAFVKWLPYFFGMYIKKEKEEYALNLIKIARRKGIPQAQINGILNMKEAEINEEQNELSELESEFFSLDDNKKFDFVVDNWSANPYLVQSYVLELDEKKEFETVERLCKKLMELSNNFPTFEFLLGLNYTRIQKPNLAKQHIANAIKTIEESPAELFPPKEKENMLNKMKEEMKKAGKDVIRR